MKGLIWFRFHAQALRHPKIASLPDRIFRFWCQCLCLAAENGGHLPSTKQIAWDVRKSEKQTQAMLSALCELRLIDRDGEMFAPHNWQRHQYLSDSSTERVRAHRKRKLGDAETETETVSQRCGNVSETVPETDIQRQSTETHTSVSRVCVADLDGQASNRFEEFWARYPRRQKRDEAARAWISVVTEANCEDVLRCLHRYNASDEVARGVVCNGANWLFQQARDNWQGDWPAARITRAKRYVALEPDAAATDDARNIEAWRAILLDPNETEEAKEYSRQRLAGIGETA